MDEVCITFLEGDVVVLPLAVLCRPLVRTVNISERPCFRFSDISFLDPTSFTGKVGSTKDCLDFMWRLCLWCFFPWSGSPSVDIILKVPKTDEFFDLILKRDTLLRNMTDVLVVSTILVLVPFRADSTQQVGPFEDSGLFSCHKDVFS